VCCEALFQEREFVHVLREALRLRSQTSAPCLNEHDHLAGTLGDGLEVIES